MKKSIDYLNKKYLKFLKKHKITTQDIYNLEMLIKKHPNLSVDVITPEGKLTPGIFKYYHEWLLAKRTTKFQDYIDCKPPVAMRLNDIMNGCFICSYLLNEKQFSISIKDKNKTVGDKPLFAVKGLKISPFQANVAGLTGDEIISRCKPVLQMWDKKDLDAFFKTFTKVESKGLIK